ncbi:DUF808 domain-containing protein [Corynebacterium breve]|uniref:DUF808 domain-containing protein n=1 Tax=Corynebacterium breve TaxID=3049799 RepID=A0ABY8VIU6_9CORY|nr:DUF808 domain-containing protein [Corynebacterium breve]WIM68543.1 DUF808 domain-containing protein [Corynebacterium breve]
MAGGLLALLDDVALIARAAASSADDVASLAAKTSVKAAGVVIDDAAVTPQYVSGITPARELPMIWRITKGSFVNKLIIILPIALLLSEFAPWMLTPILMLGGTYLAYEGAHKIVHKLSRDEHEAVEKAENKSGADEDSMVKSAIMTDLILSAEIMVISLNEIAAEGIWMRAAVLAVVAILITVAVYGAVGLLVKMDDIGLHMITSGKNEKLGRALVNGMPIVLSVIGVVGTIAMLWVGGHIMVVGFEEFGWAWPYETIHGWENAVGGGALGWFANTGGSFIVGLIWGLIIVALLAVIKLLIPGRKDDDEVTAPVESPAAASAAGSTATDLTEQD